VISVSRRFSPLAGVTVTEKLLNDLVYVRPVV
jgi:hypothetical protein